MRDILVLVLYKNPKRRGIRNRVLFWSIILQRVVSRRDSHNFRTKLFPTPECVSYLARIIVCYNKFRPCLAADVGIAGRRGTLG